MSELLKKFNILISEIESRFGEVLLAPRFSVLLFRSVGYLRIFWYFVKFLLSIASSKLLIDQLTLKESKLIFILEIHSFPAEIFRLVVKFYSRSYIRVICGLGGIIPAVFGLYLIGLN